MAEQLLIGIDIGTGSSKGVLVRLDGSVVALSEQPHSLSLPKPGWAEHDAETVWWADFKAICDELVEASGADEIAGVAISGIGPCFLAADENANPLRPGILYGIDTRAMAEVHVLTEKPVAHTVADGERLTERARHAEVTVGLVLQNRYNPTSIAIREAVRTGVLGTIVGARASLWWSRTAAYYAASPWRARWAQAGGGVLINQAIHTLDLLLWWLGEPVDVRGAAATLALKDVIEVEDTATLVIDHQGGARSVLFATNTHHTNADVEVQITGTDGTLTLIGGQAMLTDGAGTRMLAGDARDDGARSYWGMSHSALIDDFYATLARREPFWLTPEVGLPALRALRTTYAQSGLLPDDVTL